MKEIRPRLYGAYWEEIIDICRDLGTDKVYEILTGSGGDGKIEFNSADYSLSSKSSARIKTLDQLLQAGKVDLNQWEVERYVQNKWDQHSVEKGIVELFQVKAWLRRRGLEAPDDHWTNKWVNNLNKRLSSRPIHYKTTEITSTKPVVCVIADLHTGLVTKDQKIVEDYNKEICRQRLQKISAYLNMLNRPVYFMVLGDIIESFTGMNKGDTWTQIELYGAKVALETFDILEELFSGVQCFEKAYFISGNHDRISDSKDTDSRGQVTELIHGMFQRATDLTTIYDPLLISAEVDNIQYILTHGDKKISKQPPERLILDYGNGKLYNLILSAHFHGRAIQSDGIKHRMMTVPPILSGTQYEQDHGWHSTSGYLVIEEYDGKPIIKDIAL